tara:strand:- start:293 stop:688 length:396 start_codon:yes stop_codon:yes gene_type:complete
MSGQTRLHRVLEIGACVYQDPSSALLRAYERKSRNEVRQTEAEQNLQAVGRLFSFSNFFKYERDMPECLNGEWLEDFEEKILKPYAERYLTGDRKKQLIILRRAFAKFERYFSNVNGGNLRTAMSGQFASV